MFGVQGDTIVFQKILTKVPKLNFRENYCAKVEKEERADVLRKKIADLNLPVPSRVQEKLDEYEERKAFGIEGKAELSKMRYHYLRGFNAMSVEDRLDGWYKCNAKMLEINDNANEREKVRETIDDTYLKCEKEINASARLKLSRPIKEEPVDDYEEPEPDQPGPSNAQPQASTSAPVVKAKRGRKRKVQIVEVEKIYCFCQQEKRERMVGCEGKTCKFEWFHFSCVGISRAPRGEWYCNDCVPVPSSEEDDETYEP